MIRNLRVVASSRRRVVAAWEPELAAFRELASRSLGRGAWQVETAALGIGVVDAAVEMTRRIVRRAPDLALLIGTCGAMPGSRCEVGDVVAGRSAELARRADVEHLEAFAFAFARAAETAAAALHPRTSTTVPTQA